MNTSSRKPPLVAALDVPVSADIEAGYEDVAGGHRAALSGTYNSVAGGIAYDTMNDAVTAAP